MQGPKNYFTPLGHQKYVTELNDLVTKERPEILKVIQWAAGNGDRSENADYLYGKRRLREIDRRIRFLNKRLLNAVIIDPNTIDDVVIRFGATVAVLFEDGNQKKYFIVGPDEIDLSKGHISFLSPIGKALMGKEVGDEVTVHTPSGVQELEITSVLYSNC